MVVDFTSDWLQRCFADDILDRAFGDGGRAHDVWDLLVVGGSHGETATKMLDRCSHCKLLGTHLLGYTKG